MRRKANKENELLKSQNSSLVSQLSEVTKKRDTWESDAMFVRDQLRDSESQRYQAEAVLETTQKKLAASEIERKRLAEEVERLKRTCEEKDKEIERKAKLLTGEYQARRESTEKIKSMGSELQRLRTYETRMFEMASSYRSGKFGD